MSTNALATKANICDAALALLRQDAGYTANSAAAAKCDNVWNLAWSAVASAHGWNTPPGAPSDTPPSDPTLRSLLVYALARELAIPVTGRQDDLKNIAALFDAKVREAALADLSAQADSQLAGLSVLLNAEKAALPHSTPNFKSLVTSVKSAAVSEVKKVLGVTGTTLDDLAQQAADELALSRLASTLGLPEQYSQLHAQLYAAHVAEWRRVKVADTLRSSNDPILLQLVSFYKGDDSALVNAIEVYQARVDGVRADSESTIRDLLRLPSGATLTGAAKDAAIALSAAKLAPVFGFDASIVKLFMDRVDLCRKNALDSVLDAVDPENPSSMASEPFASAMAEVRRTLRLADDETPDALAVACAKELCAANNAEAYGYDGEYAAKRLVTYREKILQYRKLELDDALRDNDDPVLALLLSNFKGDDTALVNAFDVYTAKINAVKGFVSDSILSRHLWAFAKAKVAVTPANGSVDRPSDCVRVRDVTDGRNSVEWYVSGDKITTTSSATTINYTSRVPVTSWPKLVYSAYVAALAAEIAGSIVSPPEAAAQAKAYLDKLAAERLEAARVADLNEDGSGSGIVLEVKTVIKAQYRVGDADLDESAYFVKSRVERQLDAARLEVLAAHNWSFARFTIPVSPFGHPGGPFAFTRPVDALRISSVRAHDGHLVDYVIDGQTILCREPPATVSYVRDSVEVDDFPPLVRRALVYRLASDFAVSFPQRGDRPDTMLALYREKLAAAAAADAKESNPGRAAWGRSTFADAMRGQSPHHIRGFGGLATRPFHR